MKLTVAIDYYTTGALSAQGHLGCPSLMYIGSTQGFCFTDPKTGSNKYTDSPLNFEQQWYNRQITYNLCTL